MNDAGVLVVDDNLANRELYVDLLEMTPYPVFALDRGDAALAAVREHRPGLVLMDINLPGRNGFDVAAEIITELGAAAPLVLALTASTLPDLQERLRRIGFIGLLSKPCGVSTFLKAVHWAMSGRATPFQVFTD